MGFSGRPYFTFDFTLFSNASPLEIVAAPKFNFCGKGLLLSLLKAPCSLKYNITVHLQCRMKTYPIYKISDAEKFVLMIFTCLTGNCRNVLKQLHEMIRMERLDCMCGFQQRQNSVFLAKQKIMQQEIPFLST